MSGFNELLGLHIVGPVGDRFIVELDADARHLHRLGRVHGGVYLSLLDTAMARAVRLTMEDGGYAPTAEMKASFIRSSGPGRLIASAHVVHRGRHVAFAEAELSDATGRPLARASATFATLPAGDAG